MRLIYILSAVFVGAAASPMVIDNMCAKYPDATLHDSTRIRFMDGHNRFRAAAANGFAYMGPYGYTPYAEDMEVMAWKCDAEGKAIELAKQCKENGLPVPNGYKMNNIMIEKRGRVDDDAIEEALGTWRNEIMNHGLKMTFTKDMEDTVGHATKMLWHNNTNIACAVGDCQDKYSFVCLYLSGGNEVGQPIYKDTTEGAFVCSSCPAGTQCDDYNDKLCYPDWAE
ncbi:hypothetical protein Q1695_007646 [Nippostrongylus brasiliensis]|nr:hypothetical protein Q1695_007646 [Nippostrongylus brasiliensis]